MRIGNAISNATGFMASVLSDRYTPADSGAVPDYAEFDDHRITQRIAVVVRWLLLAVWLFLVNYRPDQPE